MRFDTPEGKWNLGSVVALLAIAGGLGYHAIAPIPSTASNDQKHRIEQADLTKETKNLREEITKARLDVQSHLWQAEPDEIASQSMATVDRVSQQNMVKVQSFRPQKVITVDEISRYPYSVILQGPFPRMLQLVRKLQDSGTNLAVTSVQITAADGESDTVTATVGLSAFAGTRVDENGK